MRRLSIVMVMSSLMLFGVVASASAESLAPWWHLQTGTRPGYLAPESSGQVVVTASNLGDASTSGELTFSDSLPAGLKASSVEGKVYEGANATTSTVRVSCVQPAGPCSTSGSVIPYASVELRFRVQVKPASEVTLCEQNAASCERNLATVSGGNAPAAQLSRPITITEAPAKFGLESWEITPEEAGGRPVTQAGKHPFQVTASGVLDQAAATVHGSEYSVLPVALARDIAALSPPGLIGNPTPFARCPVERFPEHCPAASALGVAMISYDNAGQGGVTLASVPLYNLQPSRGEPARFGFQVEGQNVFLDVHVRSGQDFGVTITSSDITQAVAFLGYKIIFWGAPGLAAHDSARGESCMLELHGATPEQVQEKGLSPCSPLGEEDPPPFLAMPTSCNGPPHTSTEADSWSEPMPEGHRLSFKETAPMEAMDGCNHLPFEPQINVTPDGNQASSPSGLNVDVHVPQRSILDATSLAQSDVRNITVTLPEGVAVNPAGGNGLQACSEGLVGFQGVREFEDEPGVKEVPVFTPKLPEPLQPGVNFCSTASKIGTVTIRSPLLPATQPLTGAVYLATQNENPFGSLIATYIVAEDEVSGTVLKLPGVVHLTPSGQIVATFENNPQLAFEDAELHFFGGERAPLTSPARCGAYTTSASFLPWSAEGWDEAAQTASASSTFDITSGPRTPAQPEGSPCPGASLPFSPQLTGGTSNINAGSFSPLVTTIAREDGQQNLQSVQLHMPAGLEGLLSNVKLCGEAAGQRRHLRPRIADRRNHGLGRGRQRPRLRQRRPGLHHRKIRRRPVRPVDRQPGEGGPLRPRARHLKPEPEPAL